MRALFKLNIDCGRMGSLEGIFVREESDVKGLIKSGEEVHFGEVLGKHSDVYSVITKSKITLVTREPRVIQIFDEFKLESGINPFDYIEEG